MTPEEVLRATSPKEAATKFAEWLRIQCREIGNNEAHLFLWSPEEAKRRGYGSGWSVCWEEGPFDWTMVSAGSSLYAGELGNYGSPGPFPEGLDGDGWYSEMYNTFIISFYEK